MKTVFIIYAISWLALLLIIVVLRLKDKTSYEKEELEEKEEKKKWYLAVLIYVLIIALAPLVLLIVLCIMDERKQERLDALLEKLETPLKKLKEKKEKKEKEKKKKKKLSALQNYHAAIIQNSIKYIPDYTNIAYTLFSLAEDEKYDRLLSCLNGLKLRSGWTLKVDLCKQTDIGDDSRLMVTKGIFKDFRIWDHIDVKDTPMAAWQVYLLYSLWHILPHFWHGGYNRRSYIFTGKDISSIKFIRSEYRNQLISILSEKFDNLTSEIARYNDLYYITCFYWSDWKGLVRELVEIKITNNKVKSIFKVEETILFKYHCRIWF